MADDTGEMYIQDNVKLNLKDYIKPGAVFKIVLTSWGSVFKGDFSVSGQVASIIGESVFKKN